MPELRTCISEEANEMFVEYLFGTVNILMTTMLFYDGEAVTRMVEQDVKFSEMLQLLGEKYKENCEFETVAGTEIEETEDESRKVQQFSFILCCLGYSKSLDSQPELVLKAI